MCRWEWDCGLQTGRQLEMRRRPNWRRSASTHASPPARHSQHKSSPFPRRPLHGEAHKAFVPLHHPLHPFSHNAKVGLTSHYSSLPPRCRHGHRAQPAIILTGSCLPANRLLNARTPCSIYPNLLLFTIQWLHLVPQRYINGTNTIPGLPLLHPTAIGMRPRLQQQPLISQKSDLARASRPI